MEAAFEVRDCYKELSAKIHQIVSPRGSSKINNNNSLPSLAILFQLDTTGHYWYKPPHDNAPFQEIREYQQTDTTTHHLKLGPSVYMSYPMLYSVLQGVLNDCGQDFEDCHHILINDTIPRLHKIIGSESNKGLQHLAVFLGLTFSINHRILSGEEFYDNDGIMVPASKSSMQLPERMEIDNDQCATDDCVICFEQLAGKKILCMPCSHMFHGDCITTWLDKSHRCPICRYDMPTGHK